MQVVRAIAAAIFCAIALGAAEKPVQKPQVPPLPPKLQPVYDLALSAPPEFAADAMLRLAALPAISARPLKRFLIEQAFQLGSRAHEPFAQVSSDTGDTRPALIATSLQLKLDVLSLQSRASAAMASVDRQTALSMLASVPRPAISAVNCEAPLVPMVGEYYSAVSVIAAAFRDLDERTQFLAGIISGLSSAAEVLPAANMLTGIVKAPQEATILLGSFAAKVASLPADPRTFVAYGDMTGQSFQAMLASARALGVPVEPVESGLNAYLAKQKSPGCGGQKPKRDLFWQSQTAKTIFQTGRSLWMRPEGAIVTDAERATEEWARRLTDFLSSVANWSSGDERSEADYFHERAFAYEGVLQFAPAGALRDQVLRAYVAFLVQSNLQQQSPVEWYWHPYSVLTRAGDQQLRKQVLAAFRESGNPILMLKAALERLGTSAGGPSFSLL